MKARDLVLMEFGDGSKAAAEYELKTGRDSGSLSFVWYERFVIHGAPDSHAAHYVEEREMALASHPKFPVQDWPPPNTVPATAASEYWCNACESGFDDSTEPTSCPACGESVSVHKISDSRPHPTKGARQRVSSCQ